MRSRFPTMLLAACWLVLLVVVPAQAQRTKPGQWAMGVLTVIPSDPQLGETSSPPRPLVELVSGRADLAWTQPPNYTPISETLHELSKTAILRREIWNLEFAFKPVRMIDVDVPTAAGPQQRKIWYMVYRVQYRGADLQTRDEGVQFAATSIAAIDRVDYDSRRFFPQFLLEAREVRKAYADQILPSAKAAILAREFPAGPSGRVTLAEDKLFNTVEMARQNIPRTNGGEDGSVWGYVTWEGIDPRVNFFSVYVRGLTNAYEFEDPPGAYQPGDPPGKGRKIQLKTLRLNFWRPSDTFAADEREIRFGVPIETDDRDARIAFSSLDANDDGRVEPDEVSPSQRPLFDRMRRIADRDKDGALTMNEYLESLPSENDQDRRQERTMNQYGWHARLEVIGADDGSLTASIPASLELQDALSLVAQLDSSRILAATKDADAASLRRFAVDVLKRARDVTPVRQSLKLVTADSSAAEIVESLSGARQQAVDLIRARMRLPAAFTVSTDKDSWSIQAGGRTVRLRKGQQADNWSYENGRLKLEDRLDYQWIYR